VDWYADLDGFRVDTYNYSDPAGIWTKAITDEYPNFNIVGEIWMQSQARRIGKDKIGAIKNTIPTECYGLYVIRCYWQRFSVKMMDPGTRNGESI
jgi:hypothetical protein